MATIDKPLVDLLISDIDLALESISKLRGVIIKPAKVIYDRNGQFATIKLEVAAISEAGEVLGKEVAALRNVLHRFGMTADFVGKIFTDKNKESYTLDGYNPRKKNNPFMITRLSDNNKRITSYNWLWYYTDLWPVSTPKIVSVTKLPK